MIVLEWGLNEITCDSLVRCLKHSMFFYESLSKGIACYSPLSISSTFSEYFIAQKRKN